MQSIAGLVPSGLGFHPVRLGLGAGVVGGGGVAGSGILVQMGMLLSCDHGIARSGTPWYTPYLNLETLHI